MFFSRGALFPTRKGQGRGSCANLLSSSAFRYFKGNPDVRNTDPKSTVFAKIVSGDVDCKKVFEDEDTLAFHDVNPMAPIHILIIPKRSIGGISSATDEDEKILGRLLLTARKISEQLMIQDGFRLIINDGPNGQQSVRWLHVHLLAGRALTWPPG